MRLCVFRTELGFSCSRRWIYFRFFHNRQSDNCQNRVRVSVWEIKNPKRRLGREKICVYIRVWLLRGKNQHSIWLLMNIKWVCISLSVSVCVFNIVTPPPPPGRGSINEVEFIEMQCSANWLSLDNNNGGTENSGQYCVALLIILCICHPKRLVVRARSIFKDVLRRVFFSHSCCCCLFRSVVFIWWHLMHLLLLFGFGFGFVARISRHFFFMTSYRVCARVFALALINCFGIFHFYWCGGRCVAL